LSPAKVRIVANPFAAENWDPDSNARSLTAFLAANEENPARYTIVAHHKTSKDCRSGCRKVLLTTPAGQMLRLLEKGCLAPGGPNTEMVVCQLCRNSPAWSAVEETDLHQERLVDFFDRVRFFR